MALIIAPTYTGIPHINREFKGWEVYEHGGMGYGIFDRKSEAKKKARSVRRNKYNGDVRIKCLNKDGGSKWI